MMETVTTEYLPSHPSAAVIDAYGADGPDWGGRAQQILRCQVYAAQHHLDVVDVVSESKWTGPTLTRPAFGSLFTALTTQPFPPSTLLMTDMTRLGRSMDQHEVGALIYRLQRADIQIIDVDREACGGHEKALQVPIQNRAIGGLVRELVTRCPKLK